MSNSYSKVEPALRLTSATGSDTTRAVATSPATNGNGHHGVGERTTVAVLRLREAGLPFIVVFTNPTTGGVTASYAMLGDVHLAEPGALICFAGPRVIEQTIREKLPKGFQRSEYLYDHGMVDMVVHRHNLRPTIGQLMTILTKTPAPAELAGTPVARPVVTPASTESDGELAVAPPEAAHAE